MTGLSSILLVLPLVAAHGYLSSVAIDGTLYQGNDVSRSSTSLPSIIRAVDSIEPVKGATNKDINCGANAQKAQLVADANPGSQLQFAWKSGADTDWPHNAGPMITYMASCGTTTCDQFDSSNASWFKIDEAGINSSPNAGDVTWVQAEVMNGKPYTMNLPSNVAPGQYLIRHEIIALQLAMSPGGAEFYPSCTQVNITGNGTGAPSANETVKFPGAYSDTDPGILDPNVYNPGNVYIMPGPPIASFVLGGSTSPSSSSSSVTPDPTATPTLTPTPTPTPTSSTATSSPTQSTCKNSMTKRRFPKRGTSKPMRRRHV